MPLTQLIGTTVLVFFQKASVQILSNNKTNIGPPRDVGCLEAVRP